MEKETLKQQYIDSLVAEEQALARATVSHTELCLSHLVRNMMSVCACGADGLNAPLDQLKELVHAKMAEVAPEMVAALKSAPATGMFAAWVAQREGK